MRKHGHIAVTAVLASLLLVAGCGDSSSGRPAGDAGTTASNTASNAAVTTSGSPTPDPSGTRRLELSGSAAGSFDFGSDVDDVVAGVSERFGSPDVIVGPQRYHRQAGQDTWFEDAGDPLSPAWDHPVLSVSCWQALCLVFGGDTEEDLALRGWELATVNRWGDGTRTDPATPDATLAGTGIRLGDPWRKLHAAYPSTTVGGGEGNTLAVHDTPWDGIFDGVATWRLSGQWDYEHPDAAPPGATLTRISAGQGPEPGCC
ncbi:hypothetical protein ACT8ZV_11630 [Nocardioides sp. MAHUQ-72]|uniref:hypothetical protein n=1 Tax=unclassified Nocardioides TaxID=2615069 RepID=UPI00360FDEBF